MACCGGTSASESEGEEGRVHFYRKASPDGELATIFNADDSRSYYNWRLELGRKATANKVNKQRPRFREMIDQETIEAAFELTGNHDRTVCMSCPPQENVMSEEFPYLNIIMSDLGAYSSIEITVQDERRTQRKIIAKNFVSRTCITSSNVEIPMRLKPSWNYISLDLKRLSKDAWGTKHKLTTNIRFNANFRLRRVYFSNHAFSYEELPKEFQMSLTPNSKTVKEIEEYEVTLGPMAKDLDRYLRPWIKPPVNNDSTRRFRRSLYGNARGDFASSAPQKHDAGLENDTGLRESDVARGLKLSIPSNVEILEKLMSSSLQLRKNGAQTTNYLWTYPKKPAKRRSRKFDVGLTQSTYKSLEEKLYGVGVTNSNAGQEWLKDLETSELEPFCTYIWKQDAENESLGEWDKIENFNINPKLLAKINRQRRGEGLYDIYNGKMIAKEDKEFFGFGDNDEEVKYIQDKKSLQLLMQKLDDGQLDEIDFDTFLNKKSLNKTSWQDQSSDWDFLKSVTKVKADHSDSPPKEPDLPELGDDDFVEPPDVALQDQESDASESHLGSSDSWLLTWTYDGMNWKETREMNEKKLDEELGILGTKNEEGVDKVEGTKEFPSKSSITVNNTKAVRPSASHLSTYNHVAIPSKPIMKSTDSEGLKGTDVFYHLYFDSKTLPFKN